MKNSFMAKAIELALENVRSGKGGPFAAIVVKDGKVVGEGTNQVTACKDPTAHAEIVAIRDACRTLNDFQLKGCEIYTTCEPCPMCMAAIYWARPDKIYFASTTQDAAGYGFDDRLIGEQLRLPWQERKIPMTQLMREEALQTFILWQQTPGKIEY